MCRQILGHIYRVIEALFLITSPEIYASLDKGTVFVFVPLPLHVRGTLPYVKQKNYLYFVLKIPSRLNYNWVWKYFHYVTSSLLWLISLKTKSEQTFTKPKKKKIVVSLQPTQRPRPLRRRRALQRPPAQARRPPGWARKRAWPRLETTHITTQVRPPGIIKKKL